MKFLSSSALLLLLNNISSTYGETRTFLDDAGILHTTDKIAPRILCSARTALSFHHQFQADPALHVDPAGHAGFVGTYGNYFPRGSIGNMHDPDYQPYWPTDPTAEELEFLQSIPTFSPDCYHAKNVKCDDIDVKAAIAAKPDHWVYMANGNWNTGPDMKEISDSMGSPPIILSTHYEGYINPGCITYNKSTGTYTTDESKCTARSLLDVIKRTNELGTFLNIPKVDILKDAVELCKLSTMLTKSAIIAQSKGIRVMAANPSISSVDSSLTIYPISPLTDPWLRAFEELGVPILHPGKHPSAQVGAEKIPASEWFTDCPPGATLFNSCNSNAYYPIDVWLVEGRRFFFDTPEEQVFLLEYFPDKALTANQLFHWPMNDGPISYTSASRVFLQFQMTLNKAIRQYDAQQCVNADVTSVLFLNGAYGGLIGGDYACYNEKYIDAGYAKCNIEDLKGGNQLVTTVHTENGVVKEPKTTFEPQQNHVNLPDKTIAKQQEKSMWTKDSTFREPDATIIELTGVIVILLVLVFLGIASVIVYCVCWKPEQSFGIDKSTTLEASAAAEEDVAAADKPDLPDLA